MEMNFQELWFIHRDNSVWEGTRMQAVIRLIAQRSLELYPDGEASRLTFQMTPEQEARVESLMKVPMDQLELDDRLHRATLAAQREREWHGQSPYHKEQIKKDIARGSTEWEYWHSFSAVNALLPRKNSSTPKFPDATSAERVVEKIDAAIVSQEIADKFNLTCETRDKIRNGMISFLHPSGVSGNIVHSYAKLTTNWLIEEGYVPDNTDYAELKVALRNGARAVLGIASQ